MNYIVFTEKKLEQMWAEGRGSGMGAAYAPFLQVGDFPSSGRVRRVWSPKLGRSVHLFSDVEWSCFLVLEWSREVVDIREQYPLPLELTMEVARQASIRYPRYRGTSVDMVITVDFLVTMRRGGKETHHIFDAKRSEDVEDETTMARLEIARRAVAALEIPHHPVAHTKIPSQQVKNIEWIRDAWLKDGEEEPQPGFWNAITVRMATDLASHSVNRAMSLSDYCSSFDERFGVVPGSGLRAARLLMLQRALQPDLSLPALNSRPLNTFVLSVQRGCLRAVGNS